LVAVTVLKSLSALTDIDMMMVIKSSHVTIDLLLKKSQLDELVRPVGLAMQFSGFAELSTPALVTLIALGVVQLTLQIIALVDIARRPVLAGAPKWLWIVVSVLGGLIGAAAYLALRRAAPPAPERSAAQAGDDAARRRALDSLYGPDKRT
jgi:hypothetical protein